MANILVTHVQQTSGNWCWAACSEMFLRRYGKNNLSQAALANIRRFLSQLEQLDNAHERLPSFNTDHRWIDPANSARRYQDFASAALTAGSHAIAIAVALQTEPNHPHIVGLTVTTAIAGVVLSGALLAVPLWRYRAPRKD